MEQSASYNAYLISIHALLAESDIGPLIFNVQPRRISIHALLAESDRHKTAELIINVYFYPRSPCGERPIKQEITILTIAISIHALLAESDARRASRQQPAGISIHALLAESDGSNQTIISQADDFYPRSPCGERQQVKALKVTAHRISIHALLAESDSALTCSAGCVSLFLSTLSLRRATNTRGRKKMKLNNFYPRSPCGERPKFSMICQEPQGISIHALLAESDPRLMCFWLCGRLFLSTLSLRRATWSASKLAGMSEFLSTLSLRRATHQ